MISIIYINPNGMGIGGARFPPLVVFHLLAGHRYHPEVFGGGVDVWTMFTGPNHTNRLHTLARVATRCARSGPSAPTIDPRSRHIAASEAVPV